MPCNGGHLWTDRVTDKPIDLSQSTFLAYMFYIPQNVFTLKELFLFPSNYKRRVIINFKMLSCERGYLQQTGLYVLPKLYVKRSNEYIFIYIRASFLDLYIF